MSRLGRFVVSWHNRIKFLILALACVGMVTTATSVSAQTTQVRALADCLGNAIVRPAEIVITCADAGMTVQNLRWTGWGQTFAAGLGKMIVNDCIPSCAGGTFHAYQVVLVVSAPARCTRGALAYTEVTYAFIGRSPFPPNAPGALDPTARFRCK
jgi:hypothetical protein